VDSLVDSGEAKGEMRGGVVCRALAVLFFLTCLPGTVPAADALTSHEAMDIGPSWSPDGEAVSFCSDREGNCNVWVVPVSGGSARQVTDILESIYDTSWSPDGSHIAFAAAGEDGNYDIWTVPAEGGTIERITTHEAVDDTPAWSPDGSRILFQSDRGGNIDIWSVDLRSGKLERITTDPGYDHAPSCSPDGSTVAFFSDRSGDWDVWTIPLAGGEARRITTLPANDSYPSWSPDGSFIAFQSDRGGNMDIWTIPADGGTAIRITKDRAHDSRPCWSPDGSKIAVCSDRGGDLNIWVIDLLSPSLERSLISKDGSLLPRPLGLLEKRVASLMAAAGVPGMSIAVIRDGKVFWKGALGVRNADGREPVEEDTLFEASALTKPVFAYAVLRLVDRGEIDLDRPLFQYLPYERIDHDDRYRLITPRMVLAHSSGFSSLRRNDPLSIAFEPGERFLFSGEGYIYLQKVVESICGISLEQFMEREVFGPLGMERSTFSVTGVKAEGHDWKGDVVGGGGSGFMSGGAGEANAAVSLLTTAGDYARFLIAVMNGEGLESQTAATMLSRQVDVEGEVSWGVGWGLAKRGDDSLFWHWGDSGSFQAYAIAYRELKGGLVYLTNSQNGLSIAGKVVSAIVGEGHPFLSWLDYPACTTSSMLLRRIIATAWRARGAAGVVEEMKRLYEISPDKIDEETAGLVGSFVLEARHHPQAIEIFRINTALFPESPAAFEGLARACAGAGEREKAIEYLRKSLELDPGNRTADEMLRILRGV
jgi:Tol biopolymer transport system component/CubicO group peptidase (beta-lactamase class C family)